MIYLLGSEVAGGTILFLKNLFYSNISVLYVHFCDLRPHLLLKEGATKEMNDKAGMNNEFIQFSNHKGDSAVNREDGDDDVGNDTDRRIDPGNGQLSKDVVTEDIVRRKAFRWCQDSIGGAWSHVKSDQDINISPIG